MTFSKKTLGIGVLALGLFVAAGLTASGKMCGSNKTQASASNTGGSGSCTAVHAGNQAGCAGKATTASSVTPVSGGCSGMKANSASGGCTGAKMSMASGGSCCSQGAKATMADMKLPEGTTMTRVEVPGGIDVIFTGSDIAGIQNFLNAHASMCNGDQKNCGRTCAVNATEKSVVLSIRGENPDQCCNGVMTAEAMNQNATPVQATKKSSKTLFKKS